MPHYNVHKEGGTPREKLLHALISSYWFHLFDSLGIKKVVVSPGCELGTHRDKTSDTTRKASRLEAIKEA